MISKEIKNLNTRNLRKGQTRREMGKLIGKWVSYTVVWNRVSKEGNGQASGKKGEMGKILGGKGEIGKLMKKYGGAF